MSDQFRENTYCGTCEGGRAVAGKAEDDTSVWSEPVLQRLPDRIASWIPSVLWATVLLALLGGFTYAVTWSPSKIDAAIADDCLSPPCFWDGTMPSVRDFPVIIPFVGYVLAIILGLPSVLAGTVDLLRSNWRTGAWRVLAFLGPLLVLVGMEVIPHLLNLCMLAFVMESEFRVCDGWDLTDRWHGFYHALVGGLPLVLMYTGFYRRRSFEH